MTLLNPANDQGAAVKEVVVMGKGALAIRVAECVQQSSNYSVSVIVPVMPEPTWTESFASWGRAAGITVVDSGAYKDIPALTDTDRKLPLVISVFYDKIIKPWFIQRCEKIINLHNGPLPKYRGVSPINWALKNGEVEHGLTIHEITEGIDDGPIIAQLKYSIYPQIDEVIDVYKRSLEYGRVLFEQTLPLIDRIEPREQAHQEAVYYSKQDNVRLGERTSFTRPK